jgi:hypothetical protein
MENNIMNILCAYHAQNADTCRWVIANCDENIDNITVQLWIKACKEFLANLDVDNNQI